MKDILLFLFLAGIGWFVWRAFVGTKPSGVEPEQSGEKDDPAGRHLRSTLEFARSQHEVVKARKREHDDWQLAHGHATAKELDMLSGTEFEAFLVGLFRSLGYSAELTPVTGDYGADLILSKDEQRIAVQAKRYTGSVGVSAVQEALSGQTYYKCHTAWVVTTGTFTANATELARKSRIRLIGRSDLGLFMAQRTGDPGHV